MNKKRIVFEGNQSSTYSLFLGLVLLLSSTEPDPTSQWFPASSGSKWLFLRPLFHQLPQPTALPSTSGPWNSLPMISMALNFIDGLYFSDYSSALSTSSNLKNVDISTKALPWDTFFSLSILSPSLVPSTITTFTFTSLADDSENSSSPQAFPWNIGPHFKLTTIHLSPCCWSTTPH